MFSSDWESLQDALKYLVYTPSAATSKAKKPSTHKLILLKSDTVFMEII